MTTSAETPTSHSRRRNPAPWILAAVAVLLAAYYLVVGLSGTLTSSTAVPITGDQSVPTDSYLTLQMKTQDIDLTNRVVQANLLPIAHGNLIGDRPGEIARSLRIEVSSAGLTTSVVTFPGKSVVDPTSVSLALDRGDSAYPFDQPFANFRVSVTDDETGDNVPFTITMENSARPWHLTASLGTSSTEKGIEVRPFTLDGSRDTLSVVLVLFYVLAILLTTLMAVVTIGTALLKRKLEFSNVIWLSATLLSFPALRSAMPGAPPIGTALDYLIFFPCICLIALMLVWTGAHLLWRESSTLRRRHLDDDDRSTSREELEVLEV